MEYNKYKIIVLKESFLKNRNQDKRNHQLDKAQAHKEKCLRKNQQVKI